MKQVIFVGMCAMIVAWHTLPAQDGTLDPTWDGDSRVITTIGSFDESASGIAVHRDQRIIIAGQTYIGERSALYVARYLPIGAPDMTFGSDGITT